MTVKKITMPQLGESVTEGTIMTWLVQVGDTIKKYDPIVEIMTDKVNAEVPSSYTGTIKEIIAKEGETISVGDPICSIETDQMETDEGKQDQQKQEKTHSKSQDSSMKMRYSPAVLKLSQEHQIDLSKIEGTGRGGRITRKDVEAYIASLSKQKEEPKELPQIEPQPKTHYSTEDTEIPLSNVRKAIAQNMVRSKEEIPHAWMTVEVDVTDLVSYRQAVKESFKQKEGFNLTYFPFFIKAVAQALKKYPQLNSTWAEDKIVQRKDINISIAVAKEDELYVPVIKHADEKNIRGIAREIHHLASKVRTNQLTHEDITDGTFTVNNTGTFGSIHSMGIINYPQAAILQVESIVKRPVIIDDMFAARDMVNLSLSLDHRVLDGLICGRFLAYVKEILENMNEDTLESY